MDDGYLDALTIAAEDRVSEFSLKAALDHSLKPSQGTSTQALQALSHFSMDDFMPDFDAETFDGGTSEPAFQFSDISHPHPHGTVGIVQPPPPDSLPVQPVHHLPEPPPGPLTEARHPQVVLHNVVATFDTGTAVDPRTVALRYCNTEFHPRRAAQVIMRFREPARATCLIWKSGKVVVLGTRTIQGAKAIARKCARILRHTYPAVQFKMYRVVNIVGSFKLPYPIQCEAMHENLRESHSKYDTEVFCALRYKSEDPAVKLFFFPNGHVGIVGAKDATDLERAVPVAQALAQPFRLHLAAQPDRPLLVPRAMPLISPYPYH
uniref:TATA box-binding protein-like 1 n=1 Tax=Eutreptiella gymnastica TaxID=73025 RepID=A0A7S1NCN2_9EUGL